MEEENRFDINNDVDNDHVDNNVNNDINSNNTNNEKYIDPRINDNITLMRNFTVSEIEEAIYKEKMSSIEPVSSSDKKSSGNKKLWLFVIGGILLLIIALVVVYFVFFGKDNNEEEDKKEVNNNEVKEESEEDIEKTPEEEVEEEKKYIGIYKKKKEYTFDGEDLEDAIYKVECENEECEGLLLSSQYVIIKDGETSYIYDYLKEKKLIDNLKISGASFAYDGDELEMDPDTPPTLYGFLLKSDENLYGIYNIDEGGVTVPLEYEKIETLNAYCGEGSADSDVLYVNNDLVKVYEDGKYGVIDTIVHKSIVKVANDNVCLDAVVSDIGLITATNGSKENIYALTGRSILDGVKYDDIYFYNDNTDKYAIVKDGEDISVVDYQNNVVVDLLKYDSSFEFNDAGYVSGEKIFIVYRGKDEKCVEYYYDFNLKEVKTNEEYICNVS